MKIKITHPDGEYQAGLIYDVPEKNARELIFADKAFEIVEDAKEKKVRQYDHWKS